MIFSPENFPELAKRCSGKYYGAAFWAMMISLVIIVALTFRSYGFTIDEQNGLIRATAILNFLTSLGKSTEGIVKVSQVNVYGAMPDVIALALQKTFPALAFDSRHLVSAIFGVAGIFYTYRLGCFLSSQAVGFFGALFLSINPMWFGYMFINAKDIPFAATLMASTYYCLVALFAGGGRWIWPKIAIAVGLFVTTKLTGILILGFVVVVFFALVASFNPAARSIVDKSLIRRVLLTAIATCIGSLICFLFFWPQFYFFSLREIFDVVRLFTNYSDWANQVQIHGDYFNFDSVPRYYMIMYFTISMPILLVVLAVIGSVLSAVRRDPVVAAAVICIAFFSYQAGTRALVYGGYRHFTFLLPFTSLLAAVPVARVLEFNRSQFIRISVIAAVVLGVSTSMISMYRLFPYQYSSYNLIVGGLPGADGRYYIDVWRSAMREALNKIESIDASNDRLKVFSCGSHLNYAEHPRFDPVTDPGRANYIVALRRRCPPELFKELPLSGQVLREGVVFAQIFANKEARP